MRNLFGTILSCLLAVMIFAFGFTGVTAQGSSSGTVSVQVVPSGDVGVLWAVISSVNIGDCEYSPANNFTANGTLAIGVGDLRGTASGWRVTLSGTPIESENDLISIGNLRLTTGSVESTSPNGIPGVSLPDLLPLNPMATIPKTAIFADPGIGAGTYTNWRQTSLTIPAGTPDENYQSTITVTITGSDPHPPD